MRFDVHISNPLTPAVQRFTRDRLPDLRRDLVEATLRDTLTETVRLNPVDTARSRAAWVASLEQLGGRPPAGWQGPHPTAEAAGRAAGSLVREHSLDHSSAAAANAITYVPFLEYGTARHTPFAMVRTALARARQRLLDRLRRLTR